MKVQRSPANEKKNGLWFINFNSFKIMAIRSTSFQHGLLYRYNLILLQHTESQIDHVRSDGRHFPDIIIVSTNRGADIDW